MAIIEMKVPSPGESITEVVIARWLKKIRKKMTLTKHKNLLVNVLLHQKIVKYNHLVVDLNHQEKTAVVRYREIKNQISNTTERKLNHGMGRNNSRNN